MQSPSASISVALEGIKVEDSMLPRCIGFQRVFNIYAFNFGCTADCP